MFSTIAIALLVLPAVYLLIRGGRVLNVPADNNMGDPSVPRRLVGGVLLAFALGWLLIASSTIVQAKNAGVLTTFGKPSERTLSPGLHLKAPWQKVTEVDGTIQTDEYRGKGGCIYVRIGDGSQSCLMATIRWRIVEKRANTIFGDYRSDDPTENLRKAVVSTQFKSTAQTVLSDYNPIASLEVVAGSNAAAAKDLNFAPDYDAISTALAVQMDERLGSAPLVEVQSITVSYLSLADSTQSKLNDFIAAVGDTRIAAQKKSTATEEAEANRTLSGSISNDPNVLTSKCYDVVAQALESNYSLPAGFSCWPGSGSAIVVPSGGAR